MKPRLLAACAAVSFAFWVSTVRAEDPRPNDSTLGKTPPEGAVVLFDGKSADGWIHRDGQPASWHLKAGALAVKPGSGDILTREKFGDFQLHLEFNCPYMPDARGQARGNSGVYLNGLYEVQVLDSYGLKLQDNDCGAIYKQIIPKYNVCKPPLQWQTYDITFRKPRVKDGKVIEKARVTIVHNGVTTIENAEIDVTPGGTDVPLGEDGPLLLQDHGNDVQFRNIWLAPLK
jgi:hypothetical protein